MDSGSNQKLSGAKLPTPNTASPARKTQTIALPHLGQAPPGPLNTIAGDTAGNLYYSDEINHSVVSLDSEGNIRWHITARGNAAGQFIYPMGLEIGWIQMDEKNRECLAVCDSWNHRLQFLDLDGQSIHAWTRAGEIPFLEIADVRFIPGDFNPERAAKPMSFWVVLDKGNHRLCAMGKKGELLFQIGRCFPPAMEPRWTVPGMFIARDLECTQLIKDFSPLDFSFYPQRILGHSENALYIWEPGTKRIKQVLLGNLLPIQVEGQQRLEWITANESTLLGWRKEDNRLMFFNRAGGLQAEMEVQGTPIPSNTSRDEFWIQTGSCIERWKREFGDPVFDDPQLLEICTPLLRTARSEIEQLDEPKMQSAIATWIALCDKELRLADQVLELSAYDGGEPLTSTFNDLGSLKKERLAAQNAIHETIHSLCLGTLIYHLANIFDTEPRRMIAAIRDRWGALFAPIQENFSKIQTCVDSLLIRREALLADSACDCQRLAPWIGLSQNTEWELRESLEWMYQWSGVVEGSTAMLPLPWVPPLLEFLRDKARAPGHAIYRRLCKGYPDPYSCLREIDRIAIGDAPLPEGNPSSKLRQRYSVSFVDRPRETSFCTFDASAVALDAQMQLLISNSANNEIQIVQLAPDKLESFRFPGHSQISSSGKIGIMAGGALVLAQADSQCEVRTLRFRSCDAIHIRDRRETIELREPFCLAARCNGNLWLAARTSHCVLKVDAEGECERSIGGCGLETGKLHFPESVAEFEDGVIAVAQNTWNRAIKLFDARGNEIGATKLKYRAKGMIILNGYLFVMDAYQSLFHVYERIVD